LRNQNTYHLYRKLWEIADWVFPPECAGCGKPGFRFCAECLGKVKKLDESICPKCGTPGKGKEQCDVCRKSPPPYKAMRAYAIFEDPLRQAIHRLKYKQDLALSIDLPNH